MKLFLLNLSSGETSHELKRDNPVQTFGGGGGGGGRSRLTVVIYYKLYYECPMKVGKGESLHGSFLNSRAPVKREQELHER